MEDQNVFDSVAPALSISDFAPLEKAVGLVLPGPFKQHYLRYNGGSPTDTQVQGDDAWEPTDVAMFFSIKYPLPKQGAES